MYDSITHYCGYACTYTYKFFKSGKLVICVTTNAKKDLVNDQKLRTLLPNKREYNCNSIDRVVNLPNRDIELPDKMKKNPGKTGNLQTTLKLRIGAPIVITVNHAKRKYRDDGYINGARGYVQAVQVAKDDPNKVDIV